MEPEKTIAALAALAQPHRLEVFRLLAAVGYEGLPAGAIAARLGLPANSLSFHLERLKRAQLVAVERRGRSLIYSARFDTMEVLIGDLTRDCCAGRPELCRPQRAARVGRRHQETTS